MSDEPARLIGAGSRSKDPSRLQMGCRHIRMASAILGACSARAASPPLTRSARARASVAASERGCTTNATSTKIKNGAAKAAAGSLGQPEGPFDLVISTRFRRQLNGFAKERCGALSVHRCVQFGGSRKPRKKCLASTPEHSRVGAVQPRIEETRHASPSGAA